MRFRFLAKACRVLALAVLLLLPWRSNGAPPNDPGVSKIDVQLNMHPAIKTLGVKIGTLFTDQLTGEDPYCRAAAVLVAQQAAENYGYWDSFIDLLKQTARGVQDGATYGGNKTVSQIARLAGDIIEAFDTDDPYGALGQLLVNETADWVSGKFDAGALDAAKKAAADKIKDKIINAYFPGTPKKAKEFRTTFGSCSVTVTPQFEWMTATQKGGLTLFVDGDCQCKKPLQLTSLKTIQNPHLQAVKDAELGPFKLILYLPLSKLDTSVSFSGKPVDLTKLASAAAKMKKAIEDGDTSEAKDAGDDLKKLVGQATTLSASLTMTPSFGNVEVKEFYAKCGCPGTTPRTTTGPTPPTETTGTTPQNVDRENILRRCDPEGTAREDIGFWKRHADQTTDPKAVERAKEQLKAARSKFCPCLAKIIVDPAFPKAARDEAKEIYDYWCVDPPSMTAPTPVPQPVHVTPQPQPQPQPVRSKACAENEALYQQWAERATKYPNQSNTNQRNIYLKKLCQCLQEHPDAANEELKKLCKGVLPTTPPKIIVQPFTPKPPTEKPPSEKPPIR